MAVERTNPYNVFNFLVTIDGFGGADSFQAGFQEISGLSNEITIAEYRNGNEKANHVRKVAGMNKITDVTFKRGITGSLQIYQWLLAIRSGSQERRRVQIDLRDETGTNIVMTWTLFNAMIMKYTGPTLNGKGGTDLAIEEMVVSAEDITVG